MPGNIVARPWHSHAKQDGSRELPAYFHYWGKAGAQDDGFHLLPYHCLDVAAVGRCLLSGHAVYRDGLAELTGLDGQTLIDWVGVFLALHDLGKFASSFQQLRPELLPSGVGRRSVPYTERHDFLGYRLWREKLTPWLQQAGKLPASGSRVGPTAINLWLQAVTGHHGQPPVQHSPGFHLDDHFLAPDIKAAQTFVADTWALLAPGDPLPVLDKHRMAQASWWLAGLAVLCDWLGSNRDYFPFHDTPMPLSDYWDIALQRAGTALAHTELLPATPSADLSLAQLLGRPSAVEATPLQAHARDMPLAKGAQLFVLEDVTGAGKTEAALLLAHRLMAAGQASGLYFGLPTMATANAMYERVGEVYRQFYDDKQTPSLVLAHSARDLSAHFRQSLLPGAGTVEADYAGDDEVPASTRCNAWLADSRKKALLAEMGVGTIDQALLGVLPSRHQSLRLLGLMHKVLLVDEVHACDAYMLPLLEGLLTAHASAGGSAILLSATLPQRQRQRLLDAFAKGLGQIADPIESDAYPLLSHLANGQLDEHRVATRASVQRQVRARFVDHEEAVHGLLAQVVANGQCACWIRNTVGDARASYQALKAHHPDWDIELFHARFALADRLAIEGRALHHFGRDSGPADRRGRVLIATQVVEQSLDVDFDCLITDLAPIDLIIQRAGRLQRHARDTHGNRIDGADQRGAPELIIHAPPWQEDPGPDWFADAFPIAQYVYDDHGQLWRTMQLLRQKGGFAMPDDARVLIEGVYGDDHDIPDGLQEASLNVQGENKARASQAFANALDIQAGYDASKGQVGHWSADTKTPTRLGEETTTVWLARWENGELRPWHDQGLNRWQNSSLTLSSTLVAAAGPVPDIPEGVLIRCQASLPAQGRWGVLLPLTQQPDDTWQGTALGVQQKTHVIRYDGLTGCVAASKEPTGTETNHEPD
jgi:CRISPR-associated endonuclease/helicase Cas3